MKKFAWFASFAVVLMSVSLVLAQNKGGQKPQKDTSSLEGQKAPEIALKTMDGTELKLSEQKGKVVLVDFWATWCPPCRKSLPHVQEMSESKELAEKGLVVWAVNAHEEQAKVKDFLTQNKYSFTVPMDAGGNTMKKYMVQGIPTTLVIGRDGKIRNVFVGFGPDSAKQIDDAVKSALDEKPSTPA
jgi:peroxiredoxin